MPTRYIALTHEARRRLATLGRVPREVFDLLAQSATPLKAYELLWRLQANSDEKLAVRSAPERVGVVLVGLIYRRLRGARPLVADQAV